MAMWPALWRTSSGSLTISIGLSRTWRIEAPRSPHYWGGSSRQGWRESWRSGVGMTSGRELTVTQETGAGWIAQGPTPNRPWRQGPPVLISPQLRKTGSYERKGQPNRVADREAQRRLLAEQAGRESAEVAA